MNYLKLLIHFFLHLAQAGSSKGLPQAAIKSSVSSEAGEHWPPECLAKAAFVLEPTQLKDCRGRLG